MFSFRSTLVFRLITRVQYKYSDLRQVSSRRTRIINLRTIRGNFISEIIFNCYERVKSRVTSCESLPYHVDPFLTIMCNYTVNRLQTYQLSFLLFFIYPILVVWFFLTKDPNQYLKFESTYDTELILLFVNIVDTRTRQALFFTTQPNVSEIFPQLHTRAQQSPRSFRV